MPDRLTRKAARRSDPATDEPAADPEDRLPQAPGQRTPQEVQTRFLTGLLNQTVTVYLVNGVRLSGTLRQFDPFTLVLQGADDIGTLIFKHAISTLIPGMPAVSAVPKERRTPFGKRPAPTA